MEIAGGRGDVPSWDASTLIRTFSISPLPVLGHLSGDRPHAATRPPTLIVELGTFIVALSVVFGVFMTTRGNAAGSDDVREIGAVMAASLLTILGLLPAVAAIFYVDRPSVRFAASLALPGWPSHLLKSYAAIWLVSLVCTFASMTSRHPLLLFTTYACASATILGSLLVTASIAFRLTSSQTSELAVLAATHPTSPKSDGKAIVKALRDVALFEYQHADRASGVLRLGALRQIAIRSLASDQEKTTGSCTAPLDVASLAIDELSFVAESMLEDRDGCLESLGELARLQQHVHRQRSHHEKYVCDLIAQEVLDLLKVAVSLSRSSRRVISGALHLLVACQMSGADPRRLAAAWTELVAHVDPTVHDVDEWLRIAWVLRQHGVAPSLMRELQLRENDPAAATIRILRVAFWERDAAHSPDSWDSKREPFFGVSSPVAAGAETLRLRLDNPGLASVRVELDRRLAHDAHVVVSLAFRSLLHADSSAQPAPVSLFPLVLRESLRRACANEQDAFEYFMQTWRSGHYAAVLHRTNTCLSAEFAGLGDIVANAKTPLRESLCSDLMRLIAFCMKESLQRGDSGAVGSLLDGHRKVSRFATSTDRASLCRFVAGHLAQADSSSPDSSTSTSRILERLSSDAADLHLDDVLHRCLVQPAATAVMLDNSRLTRLFSSMEVGHAEDIVLKIVDRSSTDSLVVSCKTWRNSSSLRIRDRMEQLLITVNDRADFSLPLLMVGAGRFALLRHVGTEGCLATSPQDWRPNAQQRHWIQGDGARYAEHVVEEGPLGSFDQRRAVIIWLRAALTVGCLHITNPDEAVAFLRRVFAVARTDAFVATRTTPVVQQLKPLVPHAVLQQLDTWTSSHEADRMA